MTTRPTPTTLAARAINRAHIAAAALRLLRATRYDASVERREVPGACPGCRAGEDGRGHFDCSTDADRYLAEGWTIVDESRGTSADGGAWTATLERFDLTRRVWTEQVVQERYPALIVDQGEAEEALERLHLAAGWLCKATDNDSLFAEAQASCKVQSEAARLAWADPATLETWAVGWEEWARSVTVRSRTERGEA